MADLELVFNEESGVWEERPEPYIRVEIETEEDFEYLKAAIEFYKNRDKYEEVVRCKDCQYCDMFQGETTTETMMMCMIHSFEVVDANGFCYRGERRSE